MGRPKKSPDRARTAWVQIRCSPAYAAWLRSLVIRAEDVNVAALVERLAAAEARRLGHDDPPPR